MTCPNCKIKIICKKHEVVICRCGAKLMLIEVNKTKQLVEV